MGTSRFSPGNRPGRGSETGDPEAARATEVASPPAGTSAAGVPIRPDLGPPAAGVQPVNQPGSGVGLLVAIFASAIVLVLAIYASGQATPNRTPIFQTTKPLFWLVALVVVAGSGIGAQFAERVASRGVAAGRRADALPTAWIVPTIATAAAVLLVATFHNALMIAVGPVVAFLGNAGALLARDLLDDSADSAQRAATTVHALVVLAVAFLALSVVYLNKFPTSAGVVLVGAIGFLLTLETLERGDAPPPRRILYAALAGFALGQVLIPLNWWQTWGWTGGAVLLVAFYLASGLLLAATRRDSLAPRDIVEYGLVSGAAFVLLAIFA